MKEIDCGAYRLTRAELNGNKCIEIEAQRNLTLGEINMARTIFKESIPYDKVMIANGGIIHNITNNAITIGYKITFPSKDYREFKDFSDSTVKQSYRNWFIHEMAHVWQNARGYNSFKAGKAIASRGLYIIPGAKHNGRETNKPMAYDLNVLNDELDFPHYNMEQQASIIAHYFDIKKRGSASKYFPYKKNYEFILKAFINNPYNDELRPYNYR